MMRRRSRNKPPLTRGLSKVASDTLDWGRENRSVLDLSLSQKSEIFASSLVRGSFIAPLRGARAVRLASLNRAINCNLTGCLRRLHSFGILFKNNL